MPRKGENIRKRQDGRWEARYVKGVRDNGKPELGYVYASSYQDAKAKREEKLKQIEAQKEAIRNTRGCPFNEVTDDFLEHIEFTVKRSTYCSYRQIADTHIKPYFESICSNEISDRIIDDFILEKINNGKICSSGGLAPKTVKELLLLLKRIVSYGMEKGMIQNSTLHFTPPKAEKNHAEILNPEETETLKALARNTKDKSMFGIYLCLCTGIRLGELCALKWTDVDIQKKTIDINKTMTRLPDKTTGRTSIRIDKPKTASSIRLIPVPDFLLKELKERQPKNLDTYVLTNSDDYIEPRTYYARYQRLLRTGGIPKHSFHCLRHTFATNCVAQGFDPKTLSEILGHSDVRVTFDRYVHPSMEMKQKYMNMLDG